MFEQAESHGHKFMVACDYRAKDGKVKKMYASYPSLENFVRETLLKTPDTLFYELIPEERPCKLFLDIEWIGRDDPKRRVIRRLVDKLKAYTKVRGTSLLSIAIKRNQNAVSLKILVHCTFLWRFTVCQNTQPASFSQRLNILHASKGQSENFKILEFAYSQPACIILVGARDRA